MTPGRLSFPNWYASKYSVIGFWNVIYSVKCKWRYRPPSYRLYWLSLTSPSLLQNFFKSKIFCKDSRYYALSVLDQIDKDFQYFLVIRVVTYTYIKCMIYICYWNVEQSVSQENHEVLILLYVNDLNQILMIFRS